MAAPQLVTITGGPPAISGGSFTNDVNKFWFAGTSGGTTSLYAATPTGAASFSVDMTHQPVAANCPFSDPVFMQTNSTYQLYVAFPLAGCSGPSYVARGALDRNIGAFYSALPDTGWAAPSMTPSGFLLLFTSTGSDRHLYGTTRSDYTYQFSSPSRIYMSSIGEAIEDRHAVVNADCTAIYFSSVRSGGAGGADLYAADIAAE